MVVVPTGNEASLLVMVVVPTGDAASQVFKMLPRVTGILKELQFQSHCVLPTLFAPILYPPYASISLCKRKMMFIVKNKMLTVNWAQSGLRIQYKWKDKKRSLDSCFCNVECFQFELLLSCWLPRKAVDQSLSHQSYVRMAQLKLQLLSDNQI